MKVGTLEIELLANMARLSADMQKAESTVSAAMTGISGAVAMAKTALIGLGAVAIAHSFVEAIKGAIEHADALNKLSQRTGIATEALSQLQYAAKLADVSNESLTTGIKKLNVSIASGLAGDKEKIAMFNELGIKLRDTSGSAKTADQVLIEMADAFSTARDGAGKTAMAVGLLGRAGDEMVPLLNGGGQAIRDLMHEADRLGLTISGDFAKKAEEFNDNITRVSVSGQKLAIMLGTDVVEATGKAMKAFADATIESGKLAGALAFLKTLFTGDDQHRNNVQLVEDTEKLMNLQNGLDKLRANGYTNDTMAVKSQLAQIAVVNESIKSVQAQRKVLSDEAEKAAAAQKKLDELHKTGRELKVPKAATEKHEKESEFDKQSKLIEKRLVLEEAQRDSGGKLNELEKYAVDIQTMLAENTKKLTAAEQEELLQKADQVGLVIKQNMEAEKAMVIALARQKQREEEAKGIKEFMLAETEAMNARNKYGKDLLSQIEFETKALTMNAEEVAKATIIRELEKQGIKEGTAAWDEYGQSIVNATLHKAEVQKSITDFKAVWDSVDRTAHDAFTNIFEGGKNVFTKLRDTLKATLLDLLYQMTVKKWLFDITASVTGASSSAVAGVANQAGSGLVSSAAGSLLSGSSLVGGATSVGGYFGGIANAYSTGIGASGLATTGATLVGETGLMAAGGGGLSAAFTAMGPVGWAALAATAAYAIFSKSGGGPKTEGGYSPSGLSLSGHDTGAALALAGGQRGDVASARQFSDTVSASYKSLADMLGLAQKSLEIGMFFAKDPKGTSQTQLQVTSSAGYNRADRLGGIENVGRDEADFTKAVAEETMRVLFDGLLKAQDLASGFHDILASVGENGSMADMDAAMKRISAARTQQIALEEQLFQLTHTDSEILARDREKERAAIDPLNLALYDQVQIQRDLAAEAQHNNAVSTERQGLERHLMELNGDVAGIRRQELAALDASNRAIQERIWALEDERSAAESVAAVQQQAATYTQSSSDDWIQAQVTYAAMLKKIADDAAKELQETGGKISDFLHNLRSERGGTGTAGDKLTYAREDYEKMLVKAQAGDGTALREISDAAQKYVDMQVAWSASGPETQAVIDQIMQQLGALPSVQAYQDQAIALAQQQVDATVHVSDQFTDFFALASLQYAAENASASPASNSVQDQFWAGSLGSLGTAGTGSDNALAQLLETNQQQAETVQQLLVVTASAAQQQISVQTQIADNTSANLDAQLLQLNAPVPMTLR